MTTPEVVPCCPRCGGRLEDRRATKQYAQSPDYVCRELNCNGAIFPERPLAPQHTQAAFIHSPTLNPRWHAPHSRTLSTETD